MRRGFFAGLGLREKNVMEGGLAAVHGHSGFEVYLAGIFGKNAFELVVFGSGFDLGDLDFFQQRGRRRTRLSLRA